jgi:multicomponent Na+:H+ antiporter subunit D
VIERLYFRDAPASVGVTERPDAAAADAALTADGSGGGSDADATPGTDAGDVPDAGTVGAPVPAVPMRARVIVVAAAVAAVVLGVFATDLIAAFEPVVEVSFQ